MTTLIDYALMAGASYISNRAEINRFPAPDVWLENIQMRRTRDSGFEATYFVGINNELVISFAGTDFSSIGTIFPPLGNDFWHGNFTLANGISINGSDQLVDAVEYYLTVKATNPAAHITITGHSLGGALAALVGVFFGETAYTFDQVPAYLTATSGPANLLYNALLTRNHTANELLGLRHYLDQQLIDGGVPNASLVTNTNVQGEIAGWIPGPRIGNSIDIAQQNNMPFVVGQSNLHSMALLTTFLQSIPNSPDFKTLSEVTTKLPDLLKMIFDDKLFAHNPLNLEANAPENFLERLVKHEAGVQPGASTGSAAITADLWKLAQDGGLTISDNIPTNAAINELSKALIAFAMQFYYEDTANATDPNKQLFTDLGSNGIRFDITDTSAGTAATPDAPAIPGLLQQWEEGGMKLDQKIGGKYVLKGFEYFLNYLNSGDTVAGDNTIPNGPLSLAERSIIISMVSELRDWYIQAGNGGMVATDTQNHGAFMLGGSSADTLTNQRGQLRIDLPRR